MAQIPGTKFTESAPPAETGQISWSPSLASTGGERAVTTGIEKMGRAITAYAINTMKQEMAVEASERERMIDERGWAARNAVTGDEEADRRLWETFEQDARAIAGSSKYKDVNDSLTQHINKVSPNWQQGIYISSLNKRRENIADRRKILTEDLLENGRIPEAIDLAKEDLRVGNITQAEYDNFVKTAPTESIILSAGKLIDLKNYKAGRAKLETLDDEKLTDPQRDKKSDLISQANTGEKEINEAKETEINNDIVKASDPNYPQRLSYDQIRRKITEAADKGELDSTQIRETMHFLNSITAKAGKEASQVERGEARNKIYDAVESSKKEEAKALWRENAWMFTSADNDEINNDIREMGTKTTDTILVDSLKAESDFTTAWKKDKALTDKESIAQLEIESISRRQSIRKYFKDNPEATNQQKLDAVQAILAPAKEQVAKEVTKHWYDNLYSKGYGKWYPMQTTKEKGIDETLLNIEPQDKAGFEFEVQRIGSSNPELAKKYFEKYKYKWPEIY